MSFSPSDRRRCFGRWIFFAIVFVVGPVRGSDPAAVERGYPTMVRYRPEAYRGVSSVNCVTVTPSNIVVMGGTNDVILYDGMTFDHVPVPAVFVEQVACDAAGTVWVSGDDTLGVIEPSPETGALHFVSRTDRLPPGRHTLRGWRSLVPWRDGVATLSDTELMVIGSGGSRACALPPDETGILHAVAGRLFLHRQSDGLWEFDGEKLQRVATAVETVQHRTALLPWDEQHALALVAGAGAYLLEYASGRWVKWSTPLDAVFTDAPARGGRRLPDGRFAILRDGGANGFLLANADFTEGQLIDFGGRRASGTVALDAENGLWVGLNNGLVRLDLTPGVTVFDERLGLDAANGTYSARHEGVLYCASATGLMRLVPGNPRDGTAARFVSDPRHREYCLDVCSTPVGLLVAAKDELLLFNQDGVRRIATGHSLLFTALQHHPDTWLLGSDTGLRVLTLRNGELTQRAALVPGSTLWSSAEAADGSVWAASRADGFYHIDPPADDDWAHARIEHVPVATLDASAHQGWTAVYQSLDDVSFLANDGTHRWDPATRSLPLDPRYEFEGRHDKLRNFPAVQDAEGRLWTSLWVGLSGCARPLGYYTVAGADRFSWHDAPAAAMAAVGYWGAAETRLERLPETSHEILWARSTTTLTRLELGHLAPAAAPRGWKPLFRSITQDQQPLSLTASTPRLGYSRAPITFRYTAPRHGPGANVRYETRLVGFRDTWSPADASPETTFTGLMGGPFTFEVRARDAEGHLSETAAFRFSVAPPWHRSPLAYALYATITFGLVAGFVAWRLGGAAREQRRLANLVSERTRDLALARDQAEAASRAKSSFLAAMSHELRTPLNGVIGYAQILQNDRRLAADQVERLRVVQASGEHLLGMINDVLDLAKIEAGKLELRPAPFHLGDLIRDVVAAHRPAAAAKGLTCTGEVSPGVPAWLNGDAQKLRQVLDNIIGNAVKFTARGGVAVRVTAIDAAEPDPRQPVGSFEFTVADTGRGIAAADQARLFHPFEQAQAGRGGAPGTGLGLAISRAIVERMGGELRLTSEVGRGSTFAFAIPLAVAEAVVRRDVSRVTGYLGPRRRLLIVDDEAVNRQLLIDLLLPLDFECREYASATAALADLDSGTIPAPDVAIIDVRMEDIDGLELTRRLRKRIPGPELRVLLTSASVLTFDPAEGRSAGCDDFLPKPFRTADMVDKIGTLLGLTWQTVETEAPDSGPAAPLPDELRAALRDALDEGDLVEFRRRLAAFRRSHPETIAALDPLDAAAAAFELSRLRQLIDSP